jgi:hypothetical protein
MLALDPCLHFLLTLAAQAARVQMQQVLKLWRTGALPGPPRKGGGAGRKPLIY